MHVVRGKQLVVAPADVLAALAAHRGRVLVDVGAGDARAPYRHARAHPERLVVGFDPAWQRMSETAGRAARKPAKGGAPNLVLVRGTVEDSPHELHGVADEVWVLMPWGKLLAGVVRGDDDVYAGLSTLAAPGAVLDIRIGTSIWRDPIPLEIRDLPEMTVSYANEVLASHLAEHGWTLTGVEIVDGDATAANSSWSRRLGSGAVERIIRLTARKAPHIGPGS